MGSFGKMSKDLFLLLEEILESCPSIETLEAYLGKTKNLSVQKEGKIIFVSGTMGDISIIMKFTSYEEVVEGHERRRRPRVDVHVSMDCHYFPGCAGEEYGG